MSEPVIAISDLTRRFGATTALAGVSLSMPKGAVYGLVGALIALPIAAVLRETLGYLSHHVVLEPFRPGPPPAAPG